MTKQKTQKQGMNVVVETMNGSRGRTFEGYVIKKFPKRVVIEFERTVFVPKYERYSKKKTRLHARITEEMISQINVGDYVKIRECRPLSKIIHFIVIEKIRSSINSEVKK
jgi:small subunit ribosomal protein S17